MPSPDPLGSGLPSEYRRQTAIAVEVFSPPIPINMTTDHYIRQALEACPHNEHHKEVRYLLQRALSAYKKAQSKDPRIVPVKREQQAEDQPTEDWWERPIPQSKYDALLKEFGW
jgi:hypothetical protein